MRTRSSVCPCSDVRLAVVIVCEDTPGFKDIYGTCKMYKENRWCTGGSMGPGWNNKWGSLSATVVASCCACGKQSGELLSHHWLRPATVTTACLSPRHTRAVKPVNVHALACVPVL